MEIANINCKQYDGYGFCNKKPRVGWWIFKHRPECSEIKHVPCTVVERYKRPKPSKGPSMKTDVFTRPEPTTEAPTETQWKTLGEYSDDSDKPGMMHSIPFERQDIQPDVEVIMTPLEIVRRFMHIYSRAPVEILNGRPFIDLGGVSDDLSLSILYRKANKTSNKYGE